MNYKFIKIYQDKDLSANEILMLGLIQNLCLIVGADKCVISHSEIIELFPCQISERTVRNTLDSLKNKNYIEISQKTKTSKNEYTLINYGKNCHSTMAEITIDNTKTMANSTTHYGKNCHSTMAEITIDNTKTMANFANKKRINKEINNNFKKKEKDFFRAQEKTDIFTIPKIEQIQNYITDSQPCLNSQQATDISQEFFDYYESIGWTIKGSPMIKWQNAVNGWIRKNKIFNKEPQSKFKQYKDKTLEDFTTSAKAQLMQFAESREQALMEKNKK